MVDVRHVVTERLVLDVPEPGDVQDLHEVHADPSVWEHFPSGRHTTPADTEAFLRRCGEGWSEHGLDYWTVRLREPSGTGPVVGLAGCSVRDGVVWNLYYRLSRATWGRGYAQEIIGAARTAAGQVRPELPVVACLLEHNRGSRKAAERAGLELTWTGPDIGNPDPTAVRLVYADRPLSEDALESCSRDPAIAPVAALRPATMRGGLRRRLHGQPLQGTPPPPGTG
ncbi:GNAT family N-acetyltransferase [Actinotalea sp. K2]|uniref:GNAT family N-acetyltransferase n=1 Tax=Actinotalea sp. K2 TaxID=2939438 RepID=UPI002016FE88|nr:GNAT family N-acetyltransferase [Actinotalea sp. K2]MCL3863269.1 GNAT family N-acetyltransferase [Actinotalea sp. K2]